MSDSSATVSPSAPSSSLARLQQATTVIPILLAALWLAHWYERSLGWAFAGASIILLAYAGVLGLQFSLMVKANRHDPAPRLPPGDLLAAWWREVCTAPQVFYWRQPFRWRTCPDDTATSAEGVRAMVLVHGFVCNRGLWLPWMRRLRRRGIPYASVNLEPVFGSIDAYVPLIEDAVSRAHALTGKPPLLVCHSMGGLAARAWLVARRGNAQRVCGVMTIGTPHHGTGIARFSHTTNGRQMRPDSPWLMQLESQEAGADRSHFLCWYSHADNIVFPATTATLEGADNRHLHAIPHVAMAFHPSVVDAAMTWAETGERPTPASRAADPGGGRSLSP